MILLQSKNKRKRVRCERQCNPPKSQSIASQQMPMPTPRSLYTDAWMLFIIHVCQKLARRDCAERVLLPSRLGSRCNSETNTRPPANAVASSLNLSTLCSPSVAADGYASQKRQVVNPPRKNVHCPELHQAEEKGAGRVTMPVIKQKPERESMRFHHCRWRS